MKKIIRLTESDLARIVKRVIKENDSKKEKEFDNKENLDIRRQIKGLRKGDEIIIHKPSQKGEGINKPVIFLNYNRLWDWIVVLNKDGEKLKVSTSQDPAEDTIFIEKLL